MSQIKFRAWNGKLKRMFSCDELVRDQMALLANGYFASISSVDQSLSVIYPHDHMLPLLYTGMNDADGAEICEGDIAMFTYRWFDGNPTESNLTGQIVYSDHSMSFQLKGVINKEWESHTGYKGDEDYLTPFSELNFEEADFKVIGNIYENPELLNQTESNGEIK